MALEDNDIKSEHEDEEVESEESDYWTHFIKFYM